VRHSAWIQGRWSDVSTTAIADTTAAVASLPLQTPAPSAAAADTSFSTAETSLSSVSLAAGYWPYMHPYPYTCMARAASDAPGSAIL
jgi:hypothetical protein